MNECRPSILVLLRFNVNICKPKQRSCLIQTFRQIQTRFNICFSIVMGFIAAFMEEMIFELSHKNTLVNRTVESLLESA